MTFLQADINLELPGILALPETWWVQSGLYLDPSHLLPWLTGSWCNDFKEPAQTELPLKQHTTTPFVSIKELKTEYANDDYKTFGNRPASWHGFFCHWFNVLDPIVSIPALECRDTTVLPASLAEGTQQTNNHRNSFWRGSLVSAESPNTRTPLYLPPPGPPVSMAFLIFSWSSHRSSGKPSMSAWDTIRARFQKQL